MRPPSETVTPCIVDRKFEKKYDKMAVNITSHNSLLSSSLNLYDDQKEERSLKMRQLGLTENEHGDVFVKQEKSQEETKEQEQQVSSSIQNLMEYREAPASPSASSVTESLSIENIGSPPASPPSPVPQPTQEMDDERLPNELLDEICEDIGMKEGMELDFVEFLMEQDIDPQVYMTPEAIKHFGLGSVSTSSSQTVTPSTPVTSKIPEESTTNRSCESPSTNCSVSSSTNITVATSSGSNSPASKRFHPSTSGPTSPVRINTSHYVFKTPKTPPTPRRTPLTNQCAASPSSVSSSHSKDSNSSISSAPTIQISSPQISQSQQPGQGLLMVKPQSQSCQMSQMKDASMNQKVGPPGTYQRLGRRAPPNVNVQNMQQQQQAQQQQQQQQQNRWMGQMPMPNGMMGHGPNPNQSSCAVAGGSGNVAYRMQMQQQYGRTLESPLDQGYFSNDAASVRSYDSNVSSSVTPKMVPSTPNSRMHPIAQKQMQMRGQVDSPSMQKTVHFADVAPNCDIPQMQRQLSNELSYGGQYSNIPDCDSEIQKSVPSKILSRLNHNVKCGNSPYMRPNSNSNMSPYNDYEMNHQGDIPSPAISMQQYEYPPKSDKSMYNVDNNQNMMQMGNFNNGMNSGQGIQNGGYQEGQSSCAGDPMAMHNMGSYGPNQCDIQQIESSKGSFFEPMQNNPYKSMPQGGISTLGNIQPSGVPYNNTPSGSMNNNCSMMAMNPTKRHMSVTPGHPGGQGYSQQGQNYGQGACADGSVSNPSLHMNAVGMPNQQGNPQGFDQNIYNQDGRMQGGVNQGMYPGQNRTINQAGPPGTPHSWANQLPHNQQMKDMQSNANCQTKAAGMYPMMQQHPGQMTVPQGPHPIGQCSTPNCTNCKTGSPNRPPILASQQTFIQHLITDRSSAFRSHPLFPLLRDLIIADMNFASPSFPYQLISNLPSDFDKLLQNFLHRNPPAGNHQDNFAVESVIMDALKYAHHCLIEKIKVRQDQDKHTKTTSKSISAIEEFCEKFDRSVRNSIIKPPVFQLNNQGNAAPPQTMLDEMPNQQIPVGFQTPSKQMDNMMMAGMFTPPGKKMLNLQSISNSPDFKLMKDFDNVSDISVASSSHNGKTESKKHPSLPKEAVAIMLDWLRQHKDNPYPNDDEKAMLIKQTGLTINQINYWFTNARRRILPKWAQQCK